MTWKGFNVDSRFIPEMVLLELSKSELREWTLNRTHQAYLVLKIERLDELIDESIKLLDIQGDSDVQHNLRARIAYREAAKEATQRYLSEIR